MRARPTGRGAALAALGAIAIAAAYAFGTEALLPLGVGLVALPLLAMALVALAASQLEPTRAPLPDAVRSGDVVTVASTARRTRGPAIAGLIVVRTDPCADALGKVLESGPGRTLVRLRRGVHALPPPRLEANDAFGLARRARTGHPGGVTVVAPRLVALPPAAAIACGRLGGGRRPGGAGTDLDRVREYRAGDPLAQVHWAQTAKRGRLLTKVLTGTDGGTEAIVLALEVTSGAADDLEAFEESVTATASLAHAIIVGGAAVTLEIRGSSAAASSTTTSNRGVIDRLLAAVDPGRAPETPGSRPMARSTGRAQIVITTEAGGRSGAGPRGATGTTIVIGPRAERAPARARTSGARVLAARDTDVLAALLAGRVASVRAA